MRTVNMHEAKTHLSRLVEDAVNGRPFVIARAGKPAVVVTVIENRPPPRLGFLAGQAEVPDDFDGLGADEIAALFQGSGSGGDTGPGEA